MPTKILKKRVQMRPNSNPRQKRQRRWMMKKKREEKIKEKEIENTLSIETRMELYTLIKNIPNIRKDPLKYVFEDYELRHKEDTLWLEFGVATGRTINYISYFTNDKVYGFDSFEGLPEDWRSGFGKGAFNRNGNFPVVNSNVELIKGWFNESLPPFLMNHSNKKISFIHIDCDLYSSTKCIFDLVWDKLEKDCVWVFDELVNYDGFDGQKGELLAFYELIRDYHVQYTWIGMNGVPFVNGDAGTQNVALIIHSIEKREV